MSLGMLFTIVLPATSITSEKETRSWPLLLATTIDDRQILFGKFIGILRRCLPVWIFLFGHIILFSLAEFIHPIAIIQMGSCLIHPCPAVANPVNRQSRSTEFSKGAF